MASERDPARFAKLAGSDLFEPGALQVRQDPDGLEQRTALVVEPAQVLRAWLGEVRTGRVADLARDEGGWRLVGGDGAEIARADAVIVAAALASRDLLPGLPLEAVRGQASWADGEPAVPAAAWGGYVLPTRTGLLFGATHDRGDEACDVRARMPALAERLRTADLQGRAAIRAVTPDRLPIAGPAAGGLFVLAGFGARGFTFAPLLAEHVAARALGAPSPLPAGLAAMIEPPRYASRGFSIRS